MRVGTLLRAAIATFVGAGADVAFDHASTNGIIAVMFGTRGLTTFAGFAFFTRSAVFFLGVWLGGFVFDCYGSYKSGLVARHPVRNFVGDRQHAHRGAAGCAPCYRAGLSGD
jgi:hypothetical protein